MAIITEEEEDQQELIKSKKDPTKRQKSSSSSTPSNKSPNSQNPNPFTFWFYFTVVVSLITLLFIFIPSLSPQGTKSWFLSLPASLRQHYSKGRNIKVQSHPGQSPVEVFTIEQGSGVSENVVVVHGFGLSSYAFREIVRLLGAKGVHAVAIDLPGNGFSDKSVVEVTEVANGPLGKLWDVFDEIQEKGIFFAFDKLVETGQIPYEEIGSRVSKKKVTKPIELGPEDVGKVLGQVIEAMGLAPVHLVLHDSALGMSANWVLENSESVRSVTLLDTAPRSMGALPLWVLEIPVVRELVLGFSFTYAWLVKSCCSRSVGALDVEAHRILLKGRDGRRAVVGMGKKMNYSFDIVEWGGSDGLKDVPIQVLWSSTWSKEWSEVGARVSDALPQATFATHAGERWPQEDTADELADSIVRFVTSLPATVRKVEEEPIPEHIQKRLDEAKANDDHGHDRHHGGHDRHHGGHDDFHGAGFMDAYGLGQGHEHGW